MCTQCSAALWALRAYYEHQCDKFEFVETDGEDASRIIDILLSTVTRYVMLKSDGTGNIKRAFDETLLLSYGFQEEEYVELSADDLHCDSKVRMIQ